MRKLKIFLNFDKEEAWLNDMAAQGQLLINKGSATYMFTDIEPATVVVRVDYQPSMNSTDYADYLSLFSDSGWQLLHGSQKGGAKYFASFNAEPDADIFSDAPSKAQRYKRSLAAWSALALPFAVFSFVIFTTWASHGGLLQSPKDWYLTPGLWDKHGLDFVGSFVFESFFVAIRVGGPFLLVAFTVTCLLIVAYQGNLYRKAAVRERT